jgi:uncharacterized protein (DUF1697 family)
MAQPFVALLRGINVGGKNLIPMAELKRVFEDQGFSDVATYIQSGNVVLRADEVDERKIESALSKRFDYHGRLLVLSRRQFNATVRAAPDDWGDDPNEKHNALFTLTGTTPKRILSQLPEASEFERIATGARAIFWSAPKDKITKTMFVKKLAGHPAYQQLTVRNHNTTFKLRQMLADL